MIGTRADGISPLANGFIGIEINEGCSSNTIGGLAPGSGNRIAFNGTAASRAGIRIRNQSTNNAVLGNSIFSNTSLGIAFSGLSVTANDSCDGDGGGNQQQNYPVLTQAYSGVNTGVRGYIDSRPNTTYRLQFFASPACDALGNGEGQVYLGDKIVAAGAACSNDFVATLTSAVPVGHVITATATDPANNTSEFSACRQVASTPVLNITVAGGNQLSLSWTNTAVGFALKETDNLSPPVQWSTVTNSPLVLNGQFIVTLAGPPGNRFYLLSFE